MTNHYLHILGEFHRIHNPFQLQHEFQKCGSSSQQHATTASERSESSPWWLLLLHTTTKPQRGLESIYSSMGRGVVMAHCGVHSIGDTLVVDSFKAFNGHEQRQMATNMSDVLAKMKQSWGSIYLHKSLTQSGISTRNNSTNMLNWYELT